MPVNQISFVQEEVAKHSCCEISESIEKEKEDSSNKNCCSGDAKMSCCVLVFSLAPVQVEYLLERIQFVDKVKIAILDLESSFVSSFFHPPQLV